MLVFPCFPFPKPLKDVDRDVAGSAHAAGRALRQLCEDLLRPLGLSDDQKRRFGRNMGGKWVGKYGIIPIYRCLSIYPNISYIYQWMDSGYGINVDNLSGNLVGKYGDARL